VRKKQIDNISFASAMAADDPRVIALQAYIAHERRIAELGPGKH
jgi:hypothetical protein